MKRSMRGVTAALVLAVCTAAPVRAQEVAGRPPWTWFSVGLGGGGGAERVEGMAFVPQIVHQRGPHHFALRGLLLVTPIGAECCNSAGELGVLYGRAVRGSYGYLAAAAGLAGTSIQSCGDTGECLTVGVPLLAEVGLRVLPTVGLGVQGFGNVNRLARYGGFAVFLQLGWLP